MSGGRSTGRPDAYDTVSRILHWAMAYLLAWQFLTLSGWRIVGDGSFMRAVSMLGPYHGTVGVLVLALLIPRAAWSLLRRQGRPARGSSLAGRLAGATHAGFYALMLVVPSLALVRAYANGKGFTLWGMPIVPGTGREIGWLIAPADLLHGPLAWLLAAMIAGHVGMALVHHYLLRDDTLAHMAGRWVIRAPAWSARPGDDRR